MTAAVMTIVSRMGEVSQIDLPEVRPEVVLAEVPGNAEMHMLTHWNNYENTLAEVVAEVRGSTLANPLISLSPEVRRKSYKGAAPLRALTALRHHPIIGRDHLVFVIRISEMHDGLNRGGGHMHRRRGSKIQSLPHARQCTGWSQ